MENCSGKFYVKIALLYIIVISIKYLSLPGIYGRLRKKKMTKIITFLKMGTEPLLLSHFIIVSISLTEIFNVPFN